MGSQYNECITPQIAVAAWKIHCMWECAGPYLHKLMETSSILAISEHSLFPCQLHKLNNIHQDFIAMGKSGSSLADIDMGLRRGQGGCAILWQKSLDSFVQPMPHLGSDRICQGCKISNFQSELNILETTINDCIVDGEVLIIGDMNCHFGEEYGIRGSGKSYGNSRCLMRMIAGYNMQMADIGEKGMGPKYSFYSALHKTYLDHCAVSEDLYNIVDRCEIIPDDIDNVSDHLAIQVVINVPQPQLRSSEARHQVGWDKATPDEITQFCTLPLEAEMIKLLDKYDINRATILEDQTSGKLQNVQGHGENSWSTCFPCHW